MSLLGNFWRENSVVIAILLAVFAFIQPWFIMIWRKVFKKPQIEIHPAGNLEIGYNQFWATVGIRGVLLAINEDVFIKKISLKIRNENTRDEHHFTWLGFRSSAVVFNPIETPPMELPTGFIVSKTHPFRFNIVFYDSGFKNDIDPYLQPLRQSAIEIAYNNQMKLSKGNTNWAYVYNLVHDQYVKTLEYQIALSQLKKRCYWNAGFYELKIQLDTNKGNTEFIKMMTFSIKEEEEKELLENSAITVDNPFRSVAGETASLFYFAYAEFKED